MPTGSDAVTWAVPALNNMFLLPGEFVLQIRVVDNTSPSASSERTWTFRVG